ncbi:MAG: OB-fold domain-containing protein [Pseudomonadales bacterium]
MSQAEAEVLSQAFEMGFTYTRSTGPVVGKFFTGLRNKTIYGNTASDGRIFVPPAEYNPDTAEVMGEFVEVGETGVVKSWSWVSQPRPAHPLDRPFAYALILLQGADVPMLHIVDCADEALMSTGMQVKVRWADEPRGHITDISCFEPVEGASS